MAESFSVEIQNSEVTELLKKVIHSPHNEIITNIIIGHLNSTSQGLSQLFKALNGIDNKSKWKVGMNVLVKCSNLYNSNINIELMTEKGMFHQGYINAHITNIDPFNYSNIVIIYNIFNKKEEFEQCNYSVNEQSIIEGECFPGETESEIPF